MMSPFSKLQFITAHKVITTHLKIMMSRSSQNVQKLPREVNRALYIRNLPYKITSEEMYDIFGKYGSIRQIRLGDADKETKGTAFVVYEDIFDAKKAVENLSGFNVLGRYLVVLYYQEARFAKLSENTKANTNMSIEEAQEATEEYFGNDDATSTTKR